MTLSGAITPGQTGSRSDGNEGVLRIPQRSSVSGNSPSACLVSYPGHLLGFGVLWGLTRLKRSNRCILQSQLTGQGQRGEKLNAINLEAILMGLEDADCTPLQRSKTLSCKKKKRKRGVLCMTLNCI